MQIASSCSLIIWFSLVTATYHREGELILGQNKDEIEPNIDNDFEDGAVAPWVDLSEGGARWVIRSLAVGSLGNLISTNQPPLPPPGNHYLCLEFDSSTFDIGILSTENIIVTPEDTIQFSYCIYSQYNQFQNIQVKVLSNISLLKQNVISFDFSCYTLQRN